jgi:hypothetical protein
MVGVYQHCSQQHLKCYLAEFDFRYNNRVALGVNDVERADRALEGAKGNVLPMRRLVADGIRKRGRPKRYRKRR